MTRKDLIVSAVCVIVSIVCGILSYDLLVGGIILVTGLLCAYFASEGKRINYILGLINYLLMGYVSLKNNLFGLFFFYVFVFAPLQISGFITWKKNLDADSSVKVKRFKIKSSIIVVTSCLVGSVMLGYLLTLIPGQNLPFLDSASNCINLCGVILMILRFEESWWLWLINNIIDLTIWIVMTLSNGHGSVMMLLVSIGYLLINIYGIIKWNKKAKQVA